MYIDNSVTMLCADNDFAAQFIRSCICGGVQGFTGIRLNNRFVVKDWQ